MKLFPLSKDVPVFAGLAKEVALLIQAIIDRLSRTSQKHLSFQLSLFIFHAHAKLYTYHKFDRFIYACAAILFAGKLTEQIQYPIDILKACRAILREKRGREGEDSEERIKFLMKKLFEAEINLMISVGFDMELEVGMTVLEGWEREVKDIQFFRAAVEELSLLYHTPVVLYFEPELLSLAALSLTCKNQNVTPEICGWESSLLERLKRREREVENVIETYFEKQRRTES